MVETVCKVIGWINVTQMTVRLGVLCARFQKIRKNRG